MAANLEYFRYSIYGFERNSPTSICSDFAMLVYVWKVSSSNCRLSFTLTKALEALFKSKAME
eukprot:142112-Amphidinium_carterae.1